MAAPSPSCRRGGSGEGTATLLISLTSQKGMGFHLEQSRKEVACGTRRQCLRIRTLRACEVLVKSQTAQDCILALLVALGKFRYPWMASPSVAWGR